MESTTVFRPIIELFALKNPRLQHVFNEEIEDLGKSFLDLEKTVSEISFKHEVMIAFWFAIHTQKLEIAILLT
jgi:hypothetical protein